jgi:hypothetical protein
VLAGGTL